MAEVYRDLETIVEAILDQCRVLVSRREHVLISIDGVGGSGKSALAASLASALGARVVSLDEYLDPHLGTYLPNLRYADIEGALRNAETSKMPFVIVEGLCVLSVLSRLGREPDITVYIRRVGDDGEWMDQFYYSEDNDLEEVLASLSHIEARHPETPGIADGDRELVRYHIETKPISAARIVYDRRFESPANEASA